MTSIKQSLEQSSAGFIMPDSKEFPDIFRGWLMKWTNYIKGYQKRWFVLSNGLLSYYRQAKRRCLLEYFIPVAAVWLIASFCSFLFTQKSSRGGSHLPGDDKFSKRIYLYRGRCLQFCRVKWQHAFFSSQSSLGSRATEVGDCSGTSESESHQIAGIR